MEHARAISPKVDVAVEGKEFAMPKRWSAVTLSRNWAVNKERQSWLIDRKDKGYRTGGTRDSTGPSIRAVSSSEASRTASREAWISAGRKSFGGHEISKEGVGRLFEAR